MTMIAAGQQPEPGQGQPDGGFLSWLAEVATRPGVLETVLALLICVVAVVVWLRLWRIVGTVRSRALLQDYLLGVEQALAGDLAGARKRLERVLQADPENHFARLCYGKVLAQQGEHAQAHKHHLYLRSAFAVRSVDNELQLARALAAVGRPRDAAEVAERAQAAEPRHAGLLEFLFRSQLQAGEFELATAAGRRWLQALPPNQREAAAGDFADAVAGLGLRRLQQRRLDEALTLLHESQRLRPSASTVQLLGARIEAARQGAAATAAALLPSGQNELPVPGAAPASGPQDLAHRLRPLLPAGRWVCAACGARLPGARNQCPRCGAIDSAQVDEPKLFAALDAPAFAFDAIERNLAHVRRTVKSALEGGDAATRARQEVLDLGQAAVPELLGQALARGEEVADRAVGLLRELGPGCTEALFQAAEAIEDQRLLPLLGTQLPTLVGRVVQGFDREALPYVEALFATARPRLRKVLIEYFLGLADPQEFQLVLERFPPLEILQALNKVDAPVLRRFLQALPPRHFVADVLLLQEAFYREDEVLAALRGAPNAAVLEEVLQRRGPSRLLVRELLLALADPELRPVARRLLHGFGTTVLDHMIAAFVDRERDAGARQELGTLLAELGPPAVDRLCASFGPEPAALDEDVQSVLAAMGEAAVDALAAAYARPGLLERVTVGLLRGGGNRRSQIVRALAAIGTARARNALRALRETESDPNLKLRLQQALHRIDESGAGGAGSETAGGGHGQVG